MLPANGEFLLRALTERGATLAAEADSLWGPATERTRAAAVARARRVAERIGKGPIAKDWADGLASRFDAPAWAALARRCLGCSVCTFVCPSCTCFDVNEVGTASCGERCRTWDSCTFGQFTKHASGHNPRPDQVARFRQRVLHKFSYFPQGHGGQPMCAGCGRCVSQCPVGLDIHEAVHRVMAGASGGNDAPR